MKSIDLCDAIVYYQSFETARRAKDRNNTHTTIWAQDIV